MFPNMSTNELDAVWNKIDAEGETMEGEQPIALSVDGDFPGSSFTSTDKRVPPR